MNGDDVRAMFGLILAYKWSLFATMVLVTLLFAKLQQRSVKAALVGSWFSTQWGVTSIFKTVDYLTEGYHKYPDSLFKTQIFPFGVTTVVTAPSLIRELRDGSDDYLSFRGVPAKLLHLRYTCHPLHEVNWHHARVVKNQLTRNLGKLYPDIIDEMTHSFRDVLHFKDAEGDWITVPAYNTFLSIICRVSNRIVVGAPLCRDEAFRKLAEEYSVDVFQFGFLINLFPDFMHPIVGPLLSIWRRYLKRATPLLYPLIEHRRNLLSDKATQKADIPNDYITWLLEESPPGFESSNAGIALRVLQINFLALHTSTAAFTHALYHLAAQPEYVEILRGEAEQVIRDEGWTRIAMQKMRLGDSFMREASRVNPVTLATLTRIALKDFSFSNGLTIPRDHFVTASMHALHLDDKNYKNANDFDPWRFAALRKQEGEALQHQWVHTSDEYLAFGSGKHACPGRFFAANELKAMLCYLVLNYDIKLESEGIRPPNEYTGFLVMPNQKAKVMLRQRLH